MKKYFNEFGVVGGLAILACVAFSLLWWIGEIGDFLLKN
tara:strand:- start:316 stop:432 length:117 start_codon:yes stop_codon:yes gene_type:complete